MSKVSNKELDALRTHRAAHLSYLYCVIALLDRMTARQSRCLGINSHIRPCKKTHQRSIRPNSLNKIKLINLRLWINSLKKTFDNIALLFLLADLIYFLNRFENINLKGDIFGGVTTAIISLPLALLLVLLLVREPKLVFGALSWSAFLPLCLVVPRHLYQSQLAQ